jgi:predicted nucleic acid-binding protein
VPIYLADSSIWIGARRHPQSYLPKLLSERIASDEIATCIPVALEVLVGPPNASALRQDWEMVWENLRWLEVGQPEMARARELLFELAARTAGAHRRPALDYVIAACAESSGRVTVWHWDRDLRDICEHAQIAHEAEHDRARQHGLNVEPRDEARRQRRSRESR